MGVAPLPSSARKSNRGTFLSCLTEMSQPQTCVVWMLRTWLEWNEGKVSFQVTHQIQTTSSKTLRTVICHNCFYHPKLCLVLCMSDLFMKARATQCDVVAFLDLPCIALAEFFLLCFSCRIYLTVSRTSVVNQVWWPQTSDWRFITTTQNLR